jgi:histidinol dehydrogenase
MTTATRKKSPMIKIVPWTPDKPSPVVTRFLKRPAIDPKADAVASDVLADIRQHGDAALVRYAKEFDGLTIAAKHMKVSSAEIQQARDVVDREFKLAANEALQRITRFARAGLRKDWSISSPKGGILGEQYVPFDRVGAYIPGGAAPLASTALMTVALAHVAGVPEIVACTPAGKNGMIDPFLLYALDIAGATEIYRIGGIQAIGAMAYGSRTIPPVQKIVGPGGPYVTAAKRLVYGVVALDSVAGPSEIAVLADDSADPAHVAADLLSQAEHGTGQEKALLVTNSARLADHVAQELIRQAETLSRTEPIYEVLKKGTLLTVTETLDQGMDLINLFAPEHFELLVHQPRSWLKKVKAAGAVFVGPWTPECAGDFVAGPSHVLPTGGTAALFSGLTVDDFRRRTSIVSFTSADLKDVLPVIEAFGRVEGLDGHARSARIRFQPV